jgi:hypothetical protein
MDKDLLNKISEKLSFWGYAYRHYSILGLLEAKCLSLYSIHYVYKYSKLFRDMYWIVCFLGKTVSVFGVISNYYYRVMLKELDRG